MKKSNVLMLLWAVLVVTLLPINKTFGQEAYAVLKDSILTFYYTNNPPVDAFFIAKGDLYTNIPWKKCVKKAVFDDSFKNYYPSSCYCWFYSCKELSEIIGMKENLNTSNVTDMSYMFLDCYNLRNLDLSGFNTNIVLYMTSMFRNCRSLKYLDLNSFNTENVTQMSYMFSNCYNLRTIIVEDSWNTNQITSSSSTQMFYACPILCGGKGSLCKIEGVNDVTYAKVDEGEDSPGYFTKAGDQPFMPVEAYAVLKDSTLTFYYGKNTFENAYIIERGDISYSDSWKAGVKKVIFDSSFDNYTPSNCYGWFYGCKNLINIIGMKDYLHTEKVTAMSDMFRSCVNLRNLDLSGFNTENVTQMEGMFSDCRKLQTIFVGDKWTTAALSDQTQRLFYRNSRLRGGKGTTFDINQTSAEYARIDGGTESKGYFTKAGDVVFTPEKEAYAIYKDNTLTFYYGKKSFDDYLSVEPPEWSHYYVGNFVGEYYPVLWDSITKVVFDKSFKEYRPTSCQGWFEGCCNLSEIIGMKDNLNTEKVTNMSYMFAHCPNLKEIDLSGFNTGNVVDMSYMFNQDNNFWDQKLNYTDLVTLDLCSFNTSNVTNMEGMFYGCNKLKTIYVGNGWSTQSLENEQPMFASCNQLTGNNGTIYNDLLVNSNYAHKDDGKNNPGYLSKKGESKLEVIAIEVTKLPTKTEYALGEYPLNLEGGEISVLFSDNSKQTQKLIYTDVNDYCPVTIGKHIVTVEYLGKSATFDIIVVDNGVNLYTLLNKSDSTLTFFYDNYREGAILGFTVPDSLRSAFKTAIIDPSYKNYKPEKTDSMFYGCSEMTEIIGMEYLNTQKVTSMIRMFACCHNLKDIDLSHLNTENVTDMTQMFSPNYYGLQTLDLSSFNTAKLTAQHQQLFSWCNQLTTIYVGEGWKSDIFRNDQFMFNACYKLIGGKGTKCSGDFNSGDCYGEYAHIDLGERNPGYLTAISEVFSIAINKVPLKIEFYKGQDLDIRGGEIIVTYVDKSTRIINLSSAKVLGYNSSIIGEQTLNVVYCGKETTFKVNVIDILPISIELKKMPTKTEYFENEVLDLTGGEILVTYDNETTEKIALSKASISGFDNTKIGEQTIKVSYLDLETEFKVTVSPKPIVNPYTEPAIKDGVYQISTAEELFWFMFDVNHGDVKANAALVNDIIINKDCLKRVTAMLNTTSKAAAAFATWQPIGTTENPYQGTFDGQGHTISGLYIDDNTTNNVGLFGNVAPEAVIKNLGVTDSYIAGNENVGAICGKSEGTIVNCYTVSEVKGSKNVNHLVGAKETAAVVENCYYLAETPIANDPCAKTAEEFKSGDVAKLLAKGATINGVTYSGETFAGVTELPGTDIIPQPENNDNPSTPISSISENNIKVWSYNHTIYIENAPADTKYTIIDLNGRIITTSTTKSTKEEINTNKSGIMILNIDNQSFKITQ